MATALKLPLLDGDVAALAKFFDRDHFITLNRPDRIVGWLGDAETVDVEACAAALGIRRPSGSPQPIKHRKHRTIRNALTQKNKLIVHRIVEEIQVIGNIDLTDELLAPNYVEHAGKTPEGMTPRDVKRTSRALQVAFPGLRMMIHRQIAEGDLVATYKTPSGTHTEDFFGLAPTNKQFSIEIIDILRIDENGKVAGHWAVPASGAQSHPVSQLAALRLHT